MSVELRQAPIEGVFELLCPPFMDTRGAFLNVFRAHEQEYLRSWADRGIAQVNFSRTDVVGTIRGLHLQLNPHSEAKLVRCLKGKVWDVAVDLRSDSSTYGQWHGVELTPESSNALWFRRDVPMVSRYWIRKASCSIYIPVLGFPV